MLIVVHHTVRDPVFWKAAANAPLMPYLKLHQVLPSVDGTRGVCLWEAASLEDVRNHVETFLGDVSDNEYFAVNEKNAVILSLAGSLSDGANALAEWTENPSAPLPESPAN